MYSFKTMSELQAELRSRNASVAGKKADLIKRLEAYDPTRNIGATLEPLEDPFSDTLNDIMNADSPIPNISQHEVQEYFQGFDTKPKKVFCKSPITAQNLPSKRNTCIYNPLRESDIMENYEDYVRNLAIGYGATTPTTMPLLQLYEPANPHGVKWDHTYTKNEKENVLPTK